MIYKEIKFLSHIVANISSHIPHTSWWLCKPGGAAGDANNEKFELLGGDGGAVGPYVPVV